MQIDGPKSTTLLAQHMLPPAAETLKPAEVTSEPPTVSPVREIPAARAYSEDLPRSDDPSEAHSAPPSIMQMRIDEMMKAQEAEHAEHTNPMDRDST